MFHLQEIAPILKWKQDVKGESANICEFKETALQNKIFTPFIVITLGDPTIKILHGHTRYSIPMATPSLQNKDIDFCGNCTPSKEPNPVYLQSNSHGNG